MTRYKVHQFSHWVAKILYFFHIPYGSTTDIADTISHGYGKLHDYGWWQFPLYFTNERSKSQ